MEERMSPSAVIATVVVSATLAFGFGASLARESIGPNAEIEQRADEASEYWTVLTHRVRITDSLLVLFTGLLVVATLLQWRSLLSTIDATRGIAEAEEKRTKTLERAYVFAAPKVVDLETLENIAEAVGEEDQEDVEAVVDVIERRAVGHKVRLFAENFGRTPAILKSVQWHVRPREDLPDDPQFDQDEAIHQILNPGSGKTPTKAQPLIYRFDWDKPHVAYGRIVYEDVFHAAHSSGFLYLIETSAKGTQHLPIDGFPNYLRWD